MVTSEQRLDAIYPRIRTALAWGAERHGIADFFASDEETKAAEALFNARLLDYSQGGDAELVKDATKKLIEAHARKGVR